MKMSLSNANINLKGVTSFCNEKYLQDYKGERNDLNQRNGQGCQKWNKDIQKYYGKFLCNNLHDEGIYSHITPKNSYIYEGSFYSNKFEGYARLMQSNCTYFEGLYKENKRFGPGILSHADGHQDVGLWCDQNIVRLSCVVLPQWIPTLAKSQIAKIKLLKYRKLVPVSRKSDDAFNILKDVGGSDEFALKHSKLLYNNCIRNPESNFFDKSLYDEQYFGVNDCYIDVALPPEELSKDSETSNTQSDTGNGDSSSSNVEIAIEALTKNLDRLLDCTSTEIHLIRAKCCILRTLILQDIERKQSRGNLIMPETTKKVLVNELLAWNNEDLSIRILKHTFLHRNRENIVRFNISKLLGGDREYFGESGTYECACIAFLTNCSSGQIRDVCNLVRQFDLNPDLCDSQGNAGILYAAARDRICLIKELCNFGANLDIINDEGLTPLTCCLGRYLMIQNQVTDWEIAFLGNTLIKSKDKRKVKQWCPRASLLSLISTNPAQILNETSVYFKDDKLYIAYDSKDLEIKCDIAWLLRILEVDELPSQKMQNFQKPYVRNSDERSKERFLLDLNPVKTVMTKISGKSKKKNDGKRKRDASNSTKKSGGKKNKKCKSILREASTPIIDPIQMELQNNLAVVYNTILVLLYYGADPNIGEVPLPPLMLSVFIEKPELTDQLLKSGANPNATTIDENMTTLHLLVSRPAKPELIEICTNLMAHGANPNARTNDYHWMNENKAIIGNNVGHKMEEEFDGKTPLHILGMRTDFELDPNGYLNVLAEILIANGGNLNDAYLCHTPLTLAMLKGNINLVKTLLKNGDDPNQVLQCEMGVPLTLYVLKRFGASIPEIRLCEEIMNVLVEYFANPLLPVTDCGNVVEFMINEHREIKDDTKKSKKKDAKIKKGKKDKIKLTPQQEIKIFLQQLTRNTAFRNYQSRALLTIFVHILEHNTDSYCVDLAKLLTLSDGERILRILNRRNFFKINPIIQFAYQFKTLEYLHNHGSKQTENTKIKASAKLDKKASTKSATTRTPAELVVDIFKTPLPKLNPSINSGKEPEVDEDDEKYCICFYCCWRTGKLLLPCPKCGLVYFCSEECNKMSIKENSQHPCKMLFYNNEKKRYDECLLKGIPYKAMRTPLTLKEARAKIKTAAEKIEKDPNLYREAVYAFLRGGGIFGDEHKRIVRISKGGTQYNIDGSRISKGGTQYNIDGSRISKGRTQYNADGSRKSAGGTVYDIHGNKIGRTSKGGTQYNIDGSRKSVGGTLYDKDGNKIGRTSKGGTQYNIDGSRKSVGGTLYDKDGNKIGRTSKGGTQYNIDGSRKSVGGTLYDKDGKKTGRISKGGTQYNVDGSRKSVGGTLYDKDGNKIARTSKGGTQYNIDGSRKSVGGTLYDKDGKKMGRISKGGTQYNADGSRKSVGGTLYDKDGNKTGRTSKGGTEYNADGSRKSVGGTRYSKGGTPLPNKKGKSHGNDGKSSKKGGDGDAVKHRDIGFKSGTKGERSRVSKSTISITSRSRSESRGSRRCANKDYLNIVFGRLPNKYQYFMQQLALLFPDFDFKTLCFPFVCFTDGQLYYRFLDKKPLFCETYTSV